MAVVDKMELGRTLFRTLTEIQAQIDAIKTDSLDKGIEPTSMRDSSGNWVLVPLIAAKSQCLHALAIINQRD